MCILKNHLCRRLGAVSILCCDIDCRDVLGPMILPIVLIDWFAQTPPLCLTTRSAAVAPVLIPASDLPPPLRALSNFPEQFSCHRPVWIKLISGISAFEKPNNRVRLISIFPQPGSLWANSGATNFFRIWLRPRTRSRPSPHTVPASARVSTWEYGRRRWRVTSKTVYSFLTRLSNALNYQRNLKTRKFDLD